MLADIAVVYERGYILPSTMLNVQHLSWTCHREFHYHQNVGGANIPHTWAEVFHDRPDVELVAGTERDPLRLNAFRRAVWSQTRSTPTHEEMLRKESLDIVAVATNVKGRADLTCLAVESGAKATAIEKPIAHTLHEADRMVIACAAAGVPLVAGATPANHPSYARAKELISETEQSARSSPSRPNLPPPRNHTGCTSWTKCPYGSWAWATVRRRDTGSDEFLGSRDLVQTRGEVSRAFPKGRRPWSV